MFLFVFLHINIIRPHRISHTKDGENLLKLNFFPASLILSAITDICTYVCHFVANIPKIKVSSLLCGFKKVEFNQQRQTMEILIRVKPFLWHFEITQLFHCSKSNITNLQFFFVFFLFYCFFDAKSNNNSGMNVNLWKGIIL